MVRRKDFIQTGITMLAWVRSPYLVRYAQEAARREDLRRVGNGEQIYGVVGLAMRYRPSVDFCGYWQRAHAT